MKEGMKLSHNIPPLRISQIEEEKNYFKIALLVKKLWRGEAGLVNKWV